MLKIFEMRTFVYENEISILFSEYFHFVWESSAVGYCMIIYEKSKSSGFR